MLKHSQIKAMKAKEKKKWENKIKMANEYDERRKLQLKNPRIDTNPSGTVIVKNEGY